MKILYIIALVSFAALTWAAFAITRHVRKNGAVAKSPVNEAEDSQALQDRLTGLSRSGEREVAPVQIDSAIRPSGTANQPADNRQPEPVRPATIDHP